MTEMVEHVAKAIYEKFEDRPSYARRQMNGLLAEELARAAIEAMREPTEQQLRAAWAKVDSNIDDFWRAMVDAALGEKP
jgi:hypothetical protein